VPEDGGGDAVAELWREYKQHQTPEARERLILHYAQISFVGLVALDEILATGGERQAQTMLSEPGSEAAHDPVEAFEVDEMKVLLADAISRVPDRERLVLSLYYYEGLPLGDRRRARRHREPRVPDPHQGHPPAARPAPRQRSRPGEVTIFSLS
jgi:DNA-directed RNA polymerase specialized sigma subunit